jgi:hypothetical protein
MRLPDYIRAAKVCLSAIISLSTLLAFPRSSLGQSVTADKVEARAGESRKTREDDPQEVQRRAFAISLIISLGSEARGYNDLALRPRVLARAADVVWDSDPVTGQALFRRAWEAAEKGDAEDLTAKPKEKVPSMVIGLRRLGGKDLRAEVINLVARRDRPLTEEFLAKLKSATDRETEPSNAPTRSNDGWSTSEVISKRLQAASQLLNEGQIEKALEFAAPGLNQVTASSIGFLTNLRSKNPELADQRFAMLLARAETDPSSDANTASGLSSYVFTPGFYLTFSPDGSSVWNQPETELPPPNMPPALRKRFFDVAGGILLRPLPAPDQDFTSSGRRGKYLVIRHLLPLFDHYAPDTAVALHAQLTELAGKSGAVDDGFTPQESKSSKTPGEVLERMQDELDHAKTSKERDEILASAAVKLTLKGDLRARDIANRIDASERRAQVREFVDFEFIKLAVGKKNALETARLAKMGQITQSQRAWAYTQAARLIPDSERENVLDLLGDALAEVQRIEGRPYDRAILLIGIARRMLAADRERAWQTMRDVVKAANQADNFTGENQISFSVGSRTDIRFNRIGGEEAGLSGIFRLLAKDDLDRSLDLARTFKNDAPRATATLAIASSLLSKRVGDTSNN